MSDRITFFHCPQSRSTGVYALLEELGADYDLHIMSIKNGDQRKPEYLAVNPLGKVPAIRHGDALVTEQPAVYLYLAEHFSKAGLAPAVGDPLRGPFLRWLSFYGSSFEPALVDRALKRDAPPPQMSPYGDYDAVIRTVQEQVRTGPWLLGDRFTAADVLWGNALRWTVGFGLMPGSPEVQAYIDRVTSRPAIARALAKDAEMSAAQDAAREAAGKG